MDRVGPGGLFVYAAVLLTMLAVLAGLRGRTRSAIEVKATRCPNTPMITAFDAMIRTRTSRRAFGTSAAAPATVCYETASTFSSRPLN